MTNEYENYLGIDWGASDIGVAFADGETRIAVALATLKNDRALFERLGRIINEQAVSSVVIGIPSHINREAVEYEGERFGATLKQLFPQLTVAYENEMFTTKIAEANLIARGIKRISRYDDAEAARIILQEWLDKNA